jgi:hypothetical protein
MIFFLLVSLSLLLPALLLTEEFFLRDGSRLRGRITALNSDSFYVATSMGEVRVPRESISSIEFRQEGPGSVSESLHAAPVTSKLEELGAPELPSFFAHPPIGEQVTPAAPAVALETYTHPTGHFRIGVPAGWVLDESLTKTSQEQTAAIVSMDRTFIVLVASEEFSGTLATYVSLVEIQCRSAFAHFEKLDESLMELDGRKGRRILWQAVNARAGNTPIRSLVAILPYQGRVVRISCLAPAATFDAHLATFETILASYSSTPF